MRTLHLWRVFLAISVVILMANVLFIDYVWLDERGRLEETIKRVNQIAEALAVLKTDGIEEQILEEGSQGGGDFTDRTCGTLCERVIERKVAEALDSAVISPTSPNPAMPETKTTTTVVTKTGTYYIPLSGTGFTTNRDWTDIASTETVVDWSEYGGEHTVTWDAYAKVHQGNGKTMIRLYDKTNAVEVPGSNLETGSENTAHLVSSELTLWSGKNTYVVQVKSLTGYQAYFESGRIKVIVK
jgi:hypothetical protein